MRKLLFFSLFLTLCCATATAEGGSQAHFDRAMSLYRSKMWSAAGKEFTKAREAIDQPLSPCGLQCDYMLTMCAWLAGDPDARLRAERFLQDNPHTVYHNDVLMVLACELYREGDYGRALPALLAVAPSDLAPGMHDEYYFKLGHCYFCSGNDAQAAHAMSQVSKNGRYSSAATYYTAYMDYAAGRYAQAKAGFQSIAADPAYGSIVPFYLIQIEFLQNNYTYVTSRADELIARSTRPRAMETARITAESWYHLGDNRQALRYMDLFRQLGGVMQRNENYIEGYCLYMQQDCTDAAAALGQVVGPEDALSQNAAYHLAGCYLQLGKKREAMQSFSIAGAGHYDEQVREDALFNYGKLQYELGGGVFNEAINVLTRYIKEYPASPRVPQAREYLLSAYYNSRNYEAALDAIMLIPNPDNNIKAALQKITYFRALEYHAAGDDAEADRLLRISAANRYNAKYTALSSFWRGEMAFGRGDYNGAIPFYKEYISLSPASEPEHPMAHYALGYCYFNLKQWGEASTWLGKYLALGPVDRQLLADTYNRLGDVRYSSRSFWPAMEEYDRAIKLDTPQRHYAEWRRAMVLGMVDRVPRKIESLQQIVDKGQGAYVPEALYELGRTYMSQEQFSQAASTLGKYVESYPAGPSAMDALGDLALIYQNLGRSDDALGYYKRMVAAAPNSAASKDALAGIRSIYVERNDVEGYFAYAAAAGVETDMTAVQRDSLAYASAERQFMHSPDARGAKALKGYLDNYPKGAYRPQALYSMASALENANDKAGAKEALKALSGLYFNDYTVRGLENLARLQEADKEYPAAAVSYREMSRTASTAVTVNRALEGYLRCSRLTPGADMAAVAAEVLDSPYAGKDAVRQAEFLRAGTLPAAEALPIYEKLSVESLTAEGAESAYRVIAARVQSGQLDEARKRVFALSSQNSPHSLWVGRSFLLLGDIYAREGDTFQARATWQSIVDGYPDQTDGVVEQARANIKKLK